MKIVAIMLFLGALPLGGGYYDLLRIVVSIAALINVLRGSFLFIPILILFNFIPILILFNPIVPVYLYGKGLWAMIDIVSGIAFWYNDIADEIAGVNKYKDDHL
tara:strand:- start:992 stop:1303 length:312 start_codon:yes stop_codon:yes gene_type:complete